MPDNTLPTGYHTRREILQQPDIWLETYERVAALAPAFREFLDRNHLTKESKIIFCGAGSSEFAAQAVADLYRRDGFSQARSVPTTDIVTDPSYYVGKDDTILAFSFARSGNSPESVGAYEMLNHYCRKVHHVLITCNKDGALAKGAHPEKDFSVVLPDATNDVSLVMTSSFSSMCIAALLLRNPDDMASQKPLVEKAADAARRYLAPEIGEKMKGIAERPVQRVVALGSGPLKGIAREAHLKMQEMTNGKIVSTYDSFLGFRHGPKAVVNESSLIFYFLASKDYVRRYEMDLIRQINAEHNPIAQIVVADVPVDDPEVKLDLQIVGGHCIDCNPYAAIATIVAAQRMGFHLSVANGYNPDSPSSNGVISRVVKGVKIYKPE